jgi:hypothetical protein
VAQKGVSVMETKAVPSETPEQRVKEDYRPPTLQRFGDFGEITLSTTPRGMDRNGGDGRPGS